MDQVQELIKKMENKTARVAILGLGYVGLPLAVVFAEAGFKVTGIDPIQAKVDQINRGSSYVLDIPGEQVAKLVRSGYLTATSDYSVLKDIDAVSICVPTPLRKTGDPDLSFILAVSDSLKQYVHPGMVIVLESTTYPGTTREMILPRMEENGLKVGRDFFLAFSPERVDPVRKDWTTINTPKVLGGITPACLQVSKAWYGSALKTVVPVSSAEVAEMAKLLENTFRMINIGLVNEMALMCDRMGINVWEVISAAATKPFGFMPFYPGPGLGGHCLPIDPFYLSWKSKQAGIEGRFIELAGAIYGQMPHFVIEKVQNALNNVRKPLNGSKVHILGIAYKRDIDDVRESPALDVIHLLQTRGAEVTFTDPYVPEVRLDHSTMKSSPMMPAVAEADCVVIITDHASFDYAGIVSAAKLIVDTRNALKAYSDPKIVRL